MRVSILLASVVFAVASCGGTGSDTGGVSYGGMLEVGEPRQFQLWTHCGIEWLGEFNDAEWKLSEDESRYGDDVPPGWTPSEEERADEVILLRLELKADGELLARPVGAPKDLTVTYRTSTEPSPGCD